MKQIGTLIILYIFILSSIYSNNLRFKHISINEGLISNTVNAILQDSEGFMWFGTQDGLCRYDGNDFLYFTYSPDDSCSLSNNIVEVLAEDVNGILWIGTRDGINKLNLEDYSIERVNVFGDPVTPVSVQSILPSSDGDLYFGVDFKGFFCLEKVTSELKSYVHLSSDSTSIIDNMVYSILQNENGELWVGTAKGLDLFNPSNESFTHVLKDEDVRSLSYAPDSSISIGILSKGNYYYSLDDDFVIEKKVVPVNAAEKIIVPLAFSKKNFWVGIRDKGVLFSNLLDSTSELLVHKKLDSNSISSNAVTNIYEDKWGNVWLSTYDAGVNLFESKRKAFIHIKDNYQPNGLCNNKVRSIYQDSEGDIWIGTKINGTLSKFNRKTSSFTHYGYDTNNKTSLSNDLVLCIEEDKPGFLWVGTSNGLNYFDKEKGTSKIFKHNYNAINSIASNNIYALFKQGKYLIIGHLEDGMDVYDSENKIFKHYRYSSSRGSISDNRVREIFKDSQGNIWVGTLNGLNLFDLKSGTFTQFLNDTNDSASISDNSIQSIYEDENKNLWIGTNWGINKMDLENEAFKSITTKNGLSSNAIKGILGDDQGNLWVSTNKGLSKYNPQNKSVKNYNIYDGLQANEFSPYVCYKTNNGEMLFGGNNGFNIFHPDNIFDNNMEPEVHIIDFKLFNQSVNALDSDSPLTKHISKCKQITLNYKQSVMTFDYVALNFISPEKNQFAYMMEGFEDHWNYVGAKRSATYTNLDPGTYVFKVKAANNDGYWNEEGVSMEIKIMPPPWFSWWAYVFYSLLVLSMLMALRNYTIKRAKEEKERETDQQNLSFFINVSHEFRTPLTLIFNPVKKLLSSINSSEEREALDSINLSASKLLNLTNQLLDFRKADLGHISLKVEEKDIVYFSQKVLANFKSISESKGIALAYKGSDKDLKTWFDPDKYEMILNNLLSNAIKYTNPGGAITLFVEKKKLVPKFYEINFIKKRINSDYVEIKVVDTGIGLSRSQLEHVFERFYSVSEGKSGIGIGLNYSKSLVAMHKGKIEVRSTEGKGSTFIVCLPIGKSHLKSDQICKTECSTSEIQTNIHYLESLEYDVTSKDNYPLLPSEEDSPVEGKLPVVLIVEDNKKLREQMYAELKDEYIVKQAANGQTGLEKTLEIYPDIIISDVMMPVMDGIELCDKIKSNLETCHIPIILLTAKNLIEHKMEGFKTGADDYVSKPFNMSLLKVRLENLIDSRKKMKEKYAASPILASADSFTSNNLDEAFLDKITKVVLDNLNQADFNQQQLEEKMGMSRSGLYKKIQSITGQSTSIFMRNIKLKYAAELLLGGQYPIKEIAYLTGFSSPSYFNTSFKKLYDKTPAEYVKSVIKS